MRRILIALTLALVAPPALAQTQQQRDWCFGVTATDDQTLEGCNALIQSAQQPTPVKAAAYDARAFALNNKGLYDQAITDENESIALEPVSATAFNTRGSAYHHKGLYAKAVADYSRSIAIKPGYAHAYYNRALAYEKLGNRAQAAADYRAALKFDPAMTDAQDALNALGAR